MDMAMSMSRTSSPSFTVPVVRAFVQCSGQRAKNVRDHDIGGQAGIGFIHVNVQRIIRAAHVHDGDDIAPRRCWSRRARRRRGNHFPYTSRLARNRCRASPPCGEWSRSSRKMGPQRTRQNVIIETAHMQYGNIRFNRWFRVGSVKRPLFRGVLDKRAVSLERPFRCPPPDPLTSSNTRLSCLPTTVRPRV